MIDIHKLDKVDVLISLYEHSKPQELGFLHETSVPMSREEATDFLQQTSYFDCLKGRIMKVDLSGDCFDPWLYDRDNGHGAAARAINSINT